MASHSSILAWKIPWTENPMDGKAWQVTVHKSNKLEDVDKLPETLNLPELNQEEKKKNEQINHQ